MSAVPNSAEEEAAPHCYRHLYREARVSCSRCGQPICPECMVSAAVGFQCPQCVRGAKSQARPQRTVLGGRATLASAAGRVTMILIGLNVAVFILVHLLSDRFLWDMLLVDRSTAYVNSAGQLSQVDGIADGQYWRLITAAFTHEQVLHIASNMFALFMIGPALERLLGRTRFIALYLACALGGAAATYVFAPVDTASLGASGAIMGLFGAAVVILRKLRYQTGPVLASIGLTLALPLFISNIDWRAHVGGLITGVVVGAAFAYAPPAHRKVVGASALGVVVALIAVMIAVRTNSLNA